MKVSDAIRKAIKGGWKPTPYQFLSPSKKGNWTVRGWQYDERIFLDPTFWQCLGKAMGWQTELWSEEEQNLIGPEWLYHWHRLIDHLAEGKDINSFFETL